MFVCGHKASQSRLNALSNILNHTLAQEPSSPSNELKNQILLASFKTEEEFSTLLDTAPKLVIQETKFHTTFGLSEEVLEELVFGLSISMQSAYIFCLAHHIHNALNAHGFRAPNPKLLILMLQELISNAILYGIVGINPEDRTTLKGLDRIKKHMETALKTPEMSQKRLIITLHKKENIAIFSVQAQGEWTQNERQSSLSHGLSIIKKNATSVFIDKTLNKVSFILKK